MRNQRFWIGLTLILALVVAHVARLVFFPLLSPVESQIVGTWHRRVNYPYAELVGWEFARDRSCRAVFYKNGQPATDSPIDGLWHVRDGALICYHDVGVPIWVSRPLGAGVDRMLIESLTEDTLDLSRPGAETLYKWVRAPKADGGAPANDQK